MIYLLYADNGESYSDYDTWVQEVVEYPDERWNIEKLREEAVLASAITMDRRWDNKKYWGSEAATTFADWLIKEKGFQRLEFTAIHD